MMRRISFLLLLGIMLLGGCTQIQNGDSHATDNASNGLIATEPAKDNEQRIYEFETRELYARREEKQIYGVLYMPQNADDQMPAIEIASRGYVVYCFDFCGGSTGSRSDGSTLEMSIFTEQADLEAVLAMIQEQPFVDSNNIFLMGTSMGGAVSAITAAAHEEEIQGAILLYPAFVIADDINNRFTNVEDIPDTFYHMWMTVGHVFAEDLLNYDFYQAISGYKKDVLLIHGDADSIVPLSYSERAVEIYDSAKLEILPGAGHGFYGEDAERAITWILEYLSIHTI